jgi:hypothetical protein
MKIYKVNAPLAIIFFKSIFLCVPVIVVKLIAHNKFVFTVEGKGHPARILRAVAGVGFFYLTVFLQKKNRLPLCRHGYKNP